MFNRITLMGRLVRVPELRYTSNGTPVTNFTLAVDRPFKNQDGDREADFIDCVIWKKPAELIASKTGKGNRICVDGRLQIRSYEDRNGNRRKATECVVDQFQIIDWADDKNGAQKEYQVGDSTGESDTDDDGGSDLPF